MKIYPEPQVLELPRFRDDRGSFLKVFQATHSALIDFMVRQVNLVDNPKVGILRGLHYQRGEYAAAQLFRVVRGSIQFVAFDTRLNSPTYTHASSWYLERSDQALLVPKGYATGYLTCVDDTQVLYCIDSDYHPEAEQGVRWDDPLILQMVTWKIQSPKLSDKDKSWSDFVVQYP